MAVIAQNKKAYHDYHVEEKLEAGIVLTGTEVKSCRAKDVSLQDAFAAVDKGELWLHNAHIAPYAQGNRMNHEPKRPRKLLVHHAEIVRIAKATQAKGMTLVPLAFHLTKGKVKVELGLCKGKNVHDKRDSLKKKDQEKEIRRALRGSGVWHLW